MDKIHVANNAYYVRRKKDSFPENTDTQDDLVLTPIPQQM